MGNLKNMSGSIPSNDDELYTPEILVRPIIPYLSARGFSRIWCPFDYEDSEFVLCLREAGFSVIFGHIDTGLDFFNCVPPECDCIVSNPPFSKKMPVFQRLHEIGLPFAIIMCLPCLNYQEVGSFFYESGIQLQLLIPDKRISFDGHQSSFNSSYFCSGVLPRDIIFCHLPHNNAGRNYCGSRMHKSMSLFDEGGMI